MLQYIPVQQITEFCLGDAVQFITVPLAGIVQRWDLKVDYCGLKMEEWVRARTSECRLLSGRLTRKQRKVKETVSRSVVSNSLLHNGP